MVPHVKNSTAYVNKMDPVHISLFEVYFTLPEAIRSEFGADELLLTEQVQSITGLKSLDASPGVGYQKFMGVEKPYLNPKLDNTHHEIEVTLALNLRNKVDNFVYKIFKAWNHLGYNLENGEAKTMADYTADWLKVQIGNKAGDIYREIVYKNVMLGELGAPDELKYDDNEAQNITVKFFCAEAEEINA